MEFCLRHACVEICKGTLKHISRALLYLAHYPINPSCLGLLEIQSMFLQLSRTAGIFLDFSFTHCSPETASRKKLEDCITLFISGTMALGHLLFHVWRQLFHIFYQFYSSLQQKGMSELYHSFIASNRKYWAPLLNRKFLVDYLSSKPFQSSLALLEL